MIGELIRNDNGTVTGWMAEPHYDFDQVFLERNSAPADGDPDFRIMTKSPRGRDVPVGFLWTRKAKESGATYFGGYLKSGLSGYVRLRIFRDEQQPNRWEIVRRDQQGKRIGAQKVEMPEADETQAHDYESRFSRELEDA